MEIAKHPYLKEFYSKKEMIECEGKIKLEISDSIKLGLKDYRNLIYEIVEKHELNHKSDLTKSITKSN